MPNSLAEPLWRDRFEKMDCAAVDIRFPQSSQSGNGQLDQDQEWCDVLLPDGARRVRFHDYHEVYQVRGLYEQIFYERLQCSSPFRVARLLNDVLRDFETSMKRLRVLDVGAGNGMVGEELRARGTRHVVGIDIIPEAKEAQLRDRPEVYEDFVIADLTDLPENVEERLRAQRFNCLSSVAALGYGDIPPKAFLKALDMIETPGWLAFNIKEDFIYERDSTGFCKLIRQLNRDMVIQTQALRRYRHRYSIGGKPLHYVAVIARKLVDVPDDITEQFD